MPINTPRKNSKMLTDRTTIKSLEGSRYTNCSRQILIKTQEPDIPMISIFRVDDTNKSQGLHKISTAIEKVKMKCKFQGFWQLCKLYNLRKIYCLSANRLANALASRLKASKETAWFNIARFGLAQQGRMLTCRLLCVTCSMNVKRQISHALQLIKLASGHIAPIKSVRILTAVQRSRQKVQTPVNNNQSYSQQFIILCSNFSSSHRSVSLNKLELGLTQQIKRFKKMHKEGDSCSNEKVLAVLDYIVSSCKEVKSQCDEKTRQLEMLQGSANQQKTLKTYERMEHQFKQADQELRKSLRQHNKVHAKQIKFILQNQIDMWQNNQSEYFCSSRTFLSALAVKLLTGEFEASPDSQSLEWLMDRITEMVKMSEDHKKLSKFRRTVSLAKEKSGSTLIPLADKLIEWSSCRTVHQQAILRDQTLYIQSIQFVTAQVNKFIESYAKSHSHSCDTIFARKQLHAKWEQFQPLCLGINQLIKLLPKAADTTIDHPQTPASQTKSSQQTLRAASRDRVKSQQKLQAHLKSEKQQVIDNDDVMQIIKKYQECLEKEDYDQWQKYLTSSKRRQFKQLIDILEKVNDSLNRKMEVIEAAAKESVKEVQDSVKEVEESIKVSEKMDRNKWKQEISKLKAQLQQQQKKYVGRIDILERDRKQLQAQMTANQRKLRELQDRETRDRQIIKSVQADNMKLKQISTNLSINDEKMSTLEIHNSQLKAQVICLQTELTTLRTDNQNMNNQLHLNSSAAQSAIQQLIHKHNLNLQKLQASHQQQLSALQKVKQESEYQFDQHNSRINNFSINLKLEECSDKFESVSKANQELLLQIRTLQAENAHKEEHINQLKESSGLATAEISSKSNSELRKTVEVLEGRIATLLQDVAAKSKVIERLRLQVDNQEKLRDKSLTEHEIKQRVQEETEEQAEMIKSLSQSIQSLRDCEKSEISLVRQEITEIQGLKCNHRVIKSTIIKSPTAQSFASRPETARNSNHQELQGGQSKQSISRPDLNANQMKKQQDYLHSEECVVKERKQFMKLLRNVLCSFVSCPSTEQQTQQMSNLIQEQLVYAVERDQKSDADFFSRLKEFCVQFVQSSIGSYRAQLLSKINDVQILKRKLTQFLDAEIQICAKTADWKQQLSQKL